MIFGPRAEGCTARPIKFDRMAICDPSATLTGIKTAIAIHWIHKVGTVTEINKAATVTMVNTIEALHV